MSSFFCIFYMGRDPDLIIRRQRYEKLVHYIYKITCLCGSLAGHYYIGKHSTKYSGWSYYGSGTILKSYYKKYGRQAEITYHKDILEYNDSAEENLRREKEIIGDLWKTDPLCLNLCEGGKGSTGHYVSEEGRKKMSYWGGRCLPEETRQKMSESHKGVPHSEEHNRHVSEANKGRVSPMKGKHMSELHKKRISEANKGHYAHKGGDSPRSKPVLQYDLDGNFIKRWDCAASARKEIPQAAKISEVCQGKRKQTGGYTWKFE